jgi:ribose/xylose/arabinose/galactoside ABC-type transport system permease subunit
MSSEHDLPAATRIPPERAASADGGERRSIGAAVRARVGGTAGPPIAFFIVAVFFTFGADQFLTTDNVTLILDQTAPVTIAACAMTMVILMGGIDLSVGSILSLSSVLAAVFLRDGRGVVPAIVVAILAGGAVGVLNGVVTVRWVVQPFLVTLGTLSIARGLAELVANGATVPILSDGFVNLFASKVAGIPVSALWMLAALVLSHLLLRHTVFGRQIYMIGGNEQSAIQAGVRVRRIKVVVYAFSGLLAGLAGLLVASRLSSGLPGSGVGFELDVIAAVVLGGTGFRGEGGSIVGTLFGALTIGAISNGLTLMEVDPFVQKAITGAIIIGAVVLGSARERSRR